MEQIGRGEHLKQMYISRNFPELNRSEEILADVESVAFFSLRHLQRDYSMAFIKGVRTGTSVEGMGGVMVPNSVLFIHPPCV